MSYDDLPDDYDEYRRELADDSARDAADEDGCCDGGDDESEVSKVISLDPGRAVAFQDGRECAKAGGSLLECPHVGWPFEDEWRAGFADWMPMEHYEGVTGMGPTESQQRAEIDKHNRQSRRVRKAAAER